MVIGGGAVTDTVLQGVDGVVVVPAVLLAAVPVAGVSCRVGDGFGCTVLKSRWGVYCSTSSYLMCFLVERIKLPCKAGILHV